MASFGVSTRRPGCIAAIVYVRDGEGVVGVVGGATVHRVEVEKRKLRWDADRG